MKKLFLVVLLVCNLTLSSSVFANSQVSLTPQPVSGSHHWFAQQFVPTQVEHQLQLSRGNYRPCPSGTTINFIDRIFEVRVTIFTDVDNLLVDAQALIDLLSGIRAGNNSVRQYRIFISSQKSIKSEHLTSLSTKFGVDQTFAHMFTEPASSEFVEGANVADQLTNWTWLCLKLSAETWDQPKKFQRQFCSVYSSGRDNFSHILAHELGHAGRQGMSEKLIETQAPLVIKDLGVAVFDLAL